MTPIAPGWAGIGANSSKKRPGSVSPGAGRGHSARDEQIFNTGRASTFEETLIDNAGTRRTTITRKNLYRNEHGEEFVVGVLHDITERKAMEAAVREREGQLVLFVKHCPAAVAMLDRDMKYMIVSQRWMQNYQVADQVIPGRSHYDVFPEIPPRWREIHQRCLAGAVEKCEEDEFPRADGTMDWVRWEIRPWYQADGTSGGIIIFSEIITGRKQAEAAKKEQYALRERLAKLAANTPGVLYSYRLRPDGSACFPYISPTVEAFCGVRPEALGTDGAPFLNLVAPRTGPACVKAGRIPPASSCPGGWKSGCGIRKPAGSGWKSRAPRAGSRWRHPLARVHQRHLAAQAGGGGAESATRAAGTAGQNRGHRARDHLCLSPAPGRVRLHAVC